MPKIDPDIIAKQSVNFQNISDFTPEELEKLPIQVIDNSGFYSKETPEDIQPYSNPILKDIKPEMLAYYNIGDDPKKLEELRYEQQTGWELAGKAVGTGVLKGLITIPQTLGYSIDLYNGAKALITGDNMEENEISKWLAEKKADVDKAFPIYTKEPGKSLAFNDPGWWATMASSVIESGIGYGVSGGITKAIVGTAVKGLARGLGKVATERVTSGITSLINNRAEGKAMAYDTFRATVNEGLQKWEEDYQKNVAPVKEQQEMEFLHSSIKAAQEDWLKKYPPEIGKGEDANAAMATYNRRREEAFLDISKQFTQQSVQRLKDEYQKSKDKFEIELRSEAGSNTLAQTNWNLVNLVSDYAIVSNITKARKAASGMDNIAEKLSLGQQLKNTGKQVGKTSLGESVEEGEQEVPGDYYKQEALSKFGLEDKSKPTDTIDFIVDSFFSPKTAESMFIGGVSGPIQHYTVNGVQNGINRLRGYKDNVEERIAEQKEVNVKNNELITTKQIKTFDTLKQREDIINSNLDPEEKALKLRSFDDKVFANLVYENNKKGTTKWLDNQLKDIATQTDDVEAAEKAKELIEDKKVLDKAYAKAWDYNATGAAIDWINYNANSIHAALQLKGLSFLREDNTVDPDIAKEFVAKYAQNYYNAEANKYILKNTKARNDKQQRKDIDALKNEIAETSELDPAYAEVILLDEKIAATDKTIKKLNKKLEGLSTTKPGIKGAYNRAEAYATKEQIKKLETNKQELIKEINGLQTSVKLDEKKEQLKKLESKQQKELDTKRKELEKREKELEAINDELLTAKKKIGNLKKETKTHSATTALRKDFKRKKEAITGEPKRTADKREVTSKLQNRLVTVLTGQLAKTIKTQEESKANLEQQLKDLQEIVKPVEDKLKDLKNRKHETIKNLRARQQDISNSLAGYELLDRNQAVWSNTKGFNPFAFSLMADLVIKDKKKKKSDEELKNSGKGKIVTEEELDKQYGSNWTKVNVDYQPLNSTGSVQKALWTTKKDGKRIYSETKDGEALNTIKNIKSITTLGNKQQLNKERKIEAATKNNTNKAARMALSQKGIETSEKATTLLNVLDSLVTKPKGDVKKSIDNEKDTIDSILADEKLLPTLTGILGEKFPDKLKEYRENLEGDVKPEVLVTNPIRVAYDKINKYLQLYTDAVTTAKGEERSKKIESLKKTENLFNLFEKIGKKKLSEITELLIDRANGTVTDGEGENDNTEKTYEGADEGTTKSAGQLAWRDVSNMEHGPKKAFLLEDIEQRKAFSAFVNSKDTLKQGTKVRYEIDEELMTKFVNQSTKDEEKTLKDLYTKYLTAIKNKETISLEDIGSLPVKVVFLKDNGDVQTFADKVMYCYLHDTLFGTQEWTTGKFDPKATTIIEDLQRDKSLIYNSYLKGKVVTNTVKSKSNPFLLQKDKAETLGALYPKIKKALKKVTLLFGDAKGNYLELVDKDMVLSKDVTYTTAKNGGVYLPIPNHTTNTIFPLKLQGIDIDDMSNGAEIASLIAHAYILANIHKDETSISKILATNSKEALAFKEFYDKVKLPFITNDMSIGDLIQSLVYEGVNYYEGKDSKGKLYRKAGKVYTGISPEPFAATLGSVGAIAEAIQKNKFLNYANKFVKKYPKQEEAYTKWFMENGFVSRVKSYEDSYAPEETKTRFFEQPVIELQALSLTSNEFYTDKLAKAFEESQQIVLTEDGKQYHHNGLDRNFERVSSVKDPTKTQTTNSTVKLAASRGNALDILTRQEFGAELEKLPDEVTFVGNSMNEFKKELKLLNDFFKARNEKVVTKKITPYSETYGYAGTIDIITVDNNGKYRLYDLKTSSKDLTNPSIYNQSVGKSGIPYLSYNEQHRRQLILYKKALKEAYDIDIEQMFIVPIITDESIGASNVEIYSATFAKDENGIKVIEHTDSSDFKIKVKDKEFLITSKIGSPKSTTVTSQENEDWAEDPFASTQGNKSTGTKPTITTTASTQEAIDYINNTEFTEDKKEEFLDNIKAIGIEVTGELLEYLTHADDSDITKNLRKTVQDFTATTGTSESIVTEEKPKEVDIKDVTNIFDNIDSSEFFSLATGKYLGPEKIENFEKWISSTYPEIPISVVEKMVYAAKHGGKQAYGSMVNGAIKLYQQAQLGTGFHETFEVMWLNYLTSKEKENLINEVKKDANYAARTAWARDNYNYDNEADIIRETLAEEFKYYMLDKLNWTSANPITVTNKKSFVEKFFKKLWDFVSSVFRQPYVVKSIFDRIATGDKVKIADNKNKEEVFSVSNTGFSKEQIDETANFLTYLMLSKNKTADVDKFTEAISSKDIAALNLKDVLISFVRQGAGVFKSGNKDLADNFARVALDLFTNYVEVASKPNANLQDFEINKDSVFIERLHDNLRSFGIIQEEELEEEDIKTNLNFKASYFNSSKDRASTQLKLFLGTVPEVTGIDKDGKFTYKMGSYLGLPQYVNASKVWGVLKGQLADVVGTVDKDGKVTDGFDNMMKKLQQLSGVYPWMSYITRDLQASNVPEQRQTQFWNVMSDTAINHSKSTVEEDDNGEVTVVSDHGNTNAPSEMLVDEWSGNFMDKFVEEKDNNFIVDKDKLNKIIVAYDKIVKEVSQAATKKDDSKYPELAKQFYSITEAMGITLNDRTLDYLVNTKALEEKITKVNALRLIIGDTLDKPIASKKDITVLTLYNSNDPAKLLIKDAENTEKTLNPINNERSIDILAEADALFTDNLYEASTLDHDGNRRYKYSKHSFITRTLARAKMGDVSWFESLVGTYESGFTNGLPYYNAAEWMRDIVRAVKNNGKIKFKLLNFMGIVNKSTTTERAGFADMKEADDIFLRVSKILQANPIMPTLTNADKGEYREILGVKSFPVGSVEINEGVFSSDYNTETKLKFKQILASELLATRQAYNDLFGTEPISQSKIIRYYHTDKNGNIGTREKPLGNAFKLFMFPLFNKDTEFYKKHKLDLWEADGKPFPLNSEYVDVDGNIQQNFYEDKNIDAAISEFLDMAVKTEYNLYIKNRLFENLPSSVKGNKTSIEITAHSIINSMIAGYEYAAMFTGDPRYYKNKADYPKRVPASGATTLSLRIFEDKLSPYRPKKNDSEMTDEVNYAVRPFFNKITMDNKIGTSRFIENYKKGLISAEVPEDKRDKILEPYKSTNETDAQGLGTVARFREIMRGVGKWSPNMEDYYQKYIINDEDLPKEGLKEYFEHVEDYHISFEPTKYMYYELGPDGPVFLKYSIAWLLPQFTRNLPIDKLRKQLEANDVDETVVIDGTKMGIVGGVTEVFNKKTGEILDNIDFKKQRLSNLNGGIQQELPTNYINERLVGSQVIKNMYANLDLEGNYVLNGKNVTGNDLVYHLNLMHNTLSDKGLDELKAELKYDKTTGLVDIAELKKVLIKRIKQSANYDKELVQALELGYHFDTLPGYRELLQNMLASLQNNSTVRLKQNGGTFIQMSNFGTYITGVEEDVISDYTKSQIIFLKKKSELKAPIEYTDEKGRKRIKDGQIFLPHNILEKIPNWQEVLQKEGTEGLLKLIDPRVLRVIGYRIPNQGIASNDSLEVVGILPKEMGDMVLTYADITTKTGSDFDIDKMFMIIPNYRWNNKNNKLEYIEFLDEDTIPLETRYTTYINSILSKEAKQEFFDEVKAKADLSYRAYKGKLTIKSEEFNQAAKEAIDNLFSLLGTINNKDLSIDIKEYTKELSEWKISNALKLKTLQEYVTNKIIETSEYAKYLETEKSKQSEILKQKNLADGYSLLLTNLTEAVDTINTLQDAKENYVEHIKNSMYNKYWATYQTDRAKALATKFNLIDIADFSLLPIYKQNTKEAVQNRRIELYQAVLTDIKTYPQLITSIDSPWLKGNAKYIKYLEDKRQNSKNTLGGLYELGLGQQVRLKQRMMSGQSGIGQWANQYVNHNLIQSVRDTDNLPIRLNQYLGIGHSQLVNGKQVTVFNEKYMNAGEGKIYEPDKEKFEKYDLGEVLISDAMTAYMNAFVDIAKDEYIYYINMNTMTNGMVAMLLRAGVSPFWVNAFMSQPIIKDYIEESFRNTAITIDPLKVEGKNIPIMDIVKKKYAIPETFKPTKGASDFTSDNLLKQIERPDNATQAAVLKIFSDWLPISKEFGSFVSVMKVDVNGMGKNLMEAKAISNQKDSLNVINAKYIVGVDDAFRDKGDDKATISGRLYNNSVGFALEAYKNTFFSETPEFDSTLNYVFSVFKGKGFTNKQDIELANTIYKHWFGHLISNNKNPFYVTPDELKKLTTGKDSISKRLEKLRKDAPYEFKPLFAVLQPKHGVGNGPGIVTKNNSTHLDAKAKDDVKVAFTKMLESTGEYKAFAEDLIKVSFASSKFIQSITSYQDIIPIIALLNYNKFIQDMFDTMSDQYTTVNTNFIDQFVRNNWKNKDLVLNLYSGAVTNIKSLTGTDVSSSKIFTIKDDTEVDNLVIGSDNDGNSIYKPYVKVVNKDLQSGFKTTTLYRLEGYFKNKPIYRAVSKLGYNKGGKTFWEYDKGSITESAYSRNNVALVNDMDKVITKLSNTPEWTDTQKVKVTTNPVVGVNEETTPQQEFRPAGIITPIAIVRAVVKENMIESMKGDSAEKHLLKELLKVDVATQFIGEGSGSTGKHAESWINLANTGKYSSQDVVMLAANGNRKGRFKPVVNGVLQGAYKNIDLAIQAGASFVADTEEHLNKNTYNIGEIELANYLLSKGYTRDNSNNVGLWTKATQQPVAKSYEEAVAEANLRPNKNNIPQNVNAKGTDFQLLTKFGDYTSSIEMIINGDRTRTTRHKTELDKYNIKVGSYIWQFGTDINGNTHKVLTQITDIYPHTDSNYRLAWWKEGWHESEFSRVGNWKDGYAIEFKLVKPVAKSIESGSISSNDKGIRGALTNMTELAKSKGNIKKSYPITFKGKTYKDVEEAFQALKDETEQTTQPSKENSNNYKLMANLIYTKLKAYPELTNEVTKLGGSKWILAQKHQPTSKNTVWETGGKNWFIEALNDAYNELSKQAKSTELAKSVETPKVSVKLLASNYPYTKSTAPNNPNTNYVFTENAEAYISSTGFRGVNNYRNQFPNLFKVKLNVTATNNQAGIRTDDNGKINENAIGIIVKKYQQGEKGNFVKQEGTFRDTDNDFEMFVTLNNHAFNRLTNSNKPIVIPKQFALGKAALPKRFAEWLQNKLLVTLGVNTIIKANNTEGYSGFGLEVTSVKEPTPTTDIELGRYVKYNNNTYIVTQLNTNNTIQIYNPLLEGANAKLSVSRDNITTLEDKAKTVNYKDSDYIVTGKGSIISLTSNKLMKWDANNGDRKAIIELSKQEPTNINPLQQSHLQNVVNQNKSTTTQQPVAKSTETPATNPLERVEKVSNIVLTPEQNNAVNVLKNFLATGKEQFALLKGRGGTGKTTIIKEVTKGKHVLFIAPTHKAKAVLAQTTNSKAITLATALGIDLDESTGKFRLNKFKREQFGIPVQGYNIIVIDEASMVSDELLKQLSEDIGSTTKVIFMGDNVQLPPFGQDKDSKVFDYTIVELKTRMRQIESSPIIALSDIVADNVEKEDKAVKIVITDRITKFNKDSNSGVIFENNLDTMLEMYKRDFVANPSYTKLVTFNNQEHESIQSVKNMNSRFRRMLYPVAKEEIIVGEQLTAYSSLPKDINSRNSEEQFLIENSVDYKVDAVKKVTGISKTVIATSKEKGTRQITINELNGYECTLVNNITGKQVEKPIFILSKESKKKVNSLKSELFKKDTQMAVMVGKAFADMEYGYTITSHKAQGSTYRNVYVLEDNILSSDSIRKNKNKNQSLYVAITRASDKLVLHSSSNPNNNKDLIINNPSQQTHLKSTEPTKAAINDIYKVENVKEAEKEGKEDIKKCSNQSTKK